MTLFFERKVERWYELWDDMFVERVVLGLVNVASPIDMPGEHTGQQRPVSSDNEHLQVKANVAVT